MWWDIVNSDNGNLNGTDCGKNEYKIQVTDTGFLALDFKEGLKNYDYDSQKSI